MNTAPRLYRQTCKHPQVLVTDRVYVKLQRIQQRFELKRISEVVDLVTRGIEHARPEGS